MNRIFSVSNIYLALWCLFNVTFATSNMVSRPLFVVIAAITAYYIVFNYKDYKRNLYMSGLVLLLVMFFAYGVELILSGKVYYIEFVNKKVDNPVYLITVFKSLCPIIPFYILTKKGYISEKTISIWVPIFLLTTGVTYALTYEKMLMESMTGRTDFVNNQGYMFASIIPLIFFVQRKTWVKYLYVAIIMAFVFMSMKRGAIIIGALCLLYYLRNQLKLSQGSQKPFVVISVLLFLGIGFVFLSRYFANNSFFASRVLDTLEGNTSHRDEIYGFFWKYYMNNASFIQQLFGCGANYTLSIGENYAHNDWLELLINNGLLGVICYFIYWIRAYKQYDATAESVVKYALCCALIFAFLKSFISMSYGDIGTYLALCIGYCVARNDMFKQNLINENKLSI